ncbi:hypothetical protein KP626_03965 [Christensenella sp. MSJ-20]|uniref:LA2681 family HEPN domain-containing protein n=1 Tax=Christensenella sp. MSJ-20 TaxID=2841518 RepID=UPI001C7770E2|nr:hypothetical protein KP626_03965 [Christensenella sp. MSJ-20]
MTLKEQAKEFERNFTEIIERSVRDLSSIFDDLYFKRDGRNILDTIKKAESLLYKEYNIPTQIQIHYDIATAYDELSLLEEEIKEQYFEKELYHFRYALDLYETHYDDTDNNPEAKVAQYIAMRSYTNLGNAYNKLGRYIIASDCFQNALLISNDFAMASLNYSILLFRFAPIQLKKYEQNYFYHACYHYFKQAEKCKINIENKEFLKILQNLISSFDSTYIENYLSKPLNLPPFQSSNQKEADYRNYLLLFRLFLNPCLDIITSPCFAVDSVNLPFKEPYNNKEKEFIGLFNQIKQEYNWARLLWYKISTEEEYKHYSESNLDLIDTADFSDYSLKDSMLRTAFKSAYSLFDRIGFFINEYFQVGLTGTKISFKNVWKTELINGKGRSYFIVPHPILKVHPNNPLVQAMYWLQKDFFEKDSITTAPQAEPIFKMRNDMEHNCLRTAYQLNKNISFTKYTTEAKIEDNTFRLLKLARELIIYLCLAVKFNEEKNEYTKD